jgi:hypothetical protein
VSRTVHVLISLAVIAVPVIGWFAGGWSGATTLAVYWFETVASCLLVSARALLHQRWTPLYGHFRYDAAESSRRSPQLSSFVGGFTLVSMAFCAVHAVFLGAILLLLHQNKQSALIDIDWRSVGVACLVVFAFLVVDFTVDLFSLRRWTFWRLEQLANRGLSRVIVVHLTLIIGFVAIALTDAPSSFFGVFVVLKTLAALSFVVPQYEPAEAPRWLSGLMNRVPNVHPGERFEDFWAKDRKDETTRRERNERPWTTT